MQWLSVLLVVFFLIQNSVGCTTDTLRGYQSSISIKEANAYQVVLNHSHVMIQRKIFERDTLQKWALVL